MEIVISESVKRLRKEKGLTMRQLGACVGVSDSAIAQYESGERKPPIDVCVKLANLFDVSLDVLVRGKEKDRPEGRSREEMLKMYDQMSEEELVLLQHLIGTALADKRLQAYLRQANQESR